MGFLYVSITHPTFTTQCLSFCFQSLETLDAVPGACAEYHVGVSRSPWEGERFFADPASPRLAIKGNCGMGRIWVMEWTLNSEDRYVHIYIYVSRTWWICFVGLLGVVSLFFFGIVIMWQVMKFEVSWAGPWTWDDFVGIDFLHAIFSVFLFADPAAGSPRRVLEGISWNKLFCRSTGAS